MFVLLRQGCGLRLSGTGRLFHVEHSLWERRSRDDEVVAPPPHEQIEIAVRTPSGRREFPCTIGIVARRAVNEGQGEQRHALAAAARCVVGVPPHKLIFGLHIVGFHSRVLSEPCQRYLQDSPILSQIIHTDRELFAGNPQFLCTFSTRFTQPFCALPCSLRALFAVLYPIVPHIRNSVYTVAPRFAQHTHNIGHRVCRTERNGIHVIGPAFFRFARMKTSSRQKGHMTITTAREWPSTCVALRPPLARPLVGFCGGLLPLLVRGRARGGPGGGKVKNAKRTAPASRRVRRRAARAGSSLGSKTRRGGCGWCGAGPRGTRPGGRGSRHSGCKSSA